MMSGSAPASPSPPVFVPNPLGPPLPACDRRGCCRDLQQCLATATIAGRALRNSESATSQRLNDLTATGLQVLTARDTLTSLAKARFDNQLFKTNKTLLEFADQVVQDDLLPTRLPTPASIPFQNSEL